VVFDAGHGTNNWLYECRETRGSDQCVTRSLCNVAMRIKGLLVDGIDIKLAEEDILYLEEPYKARSVLGHS
jgi:hypothetical protein